MLECLENFADEATLVRPVERGSGAAFHQLAREYDEPVIRLALRITRSEQDAQSIYCETFLRLHGKLGTSDSGNAVCVYRIAANLCLGYLQRTRPRKSGRPALHTLSPHERLVLELKHYHGLKLRTVSEVLNTPEETTRDLLLRATQKLH